MQCATWRGPAVNYESFLEDLHAVRDRAGRFRLRADSPGPVDASLTEALQELDVALEELRVTEEEVRVQHDALHDDLGPAEAERERFQSLFQLAPVAYLVTDRFGVVRQANLLAATLLGVDGPFLAGKPLASFVDGEDRRRFRERLGRPDRLESAEEWQLRLRRRDVGTFGVAVSVGVDRDDAGAVRELRWLLRVLPRAGARDRQARPPPAAAGTVPAADDVAGAMHEVVAAAALLLAADGAGVMLADQAHTLRWVTATGEAEQTFERAQRDMGEGPCIDAFLLDQVVWTGDLRVDGRWPRLGPAARNNQIRGVLSAPVSLAGRVLGTCNVITWARRDWTTAEVRSIGAFATMIGRLLGVTSEARHKGDLVTQLQGALDSRILIEQAKGVLMARDGLSDREAFDRLRRQARSRSSTINDVAREIIANRAP
jgi:PAS domain S-box-containing protein